MYLAANACKVLGELGLLTSTKQLEAYNILDGLAFGKRYVCKSKMLSVLLSMSAKAFVGVACGTNPYASFPGDLSTNIRTMEVLRTDVLKLSASDTNYVHQLKKLWGPLSEHIKEEEERDLPALEEQLTASQGESETLAKSFERTKLFVPSRSHPSAGEHPPFETAMGLLAAPMDHIADLFRKFPDKEKL